MAELWKRRSECGDEKGDCEERRRRFGGGEGERGRRGRRGRDGERGERGERGRRGAEGPPGPGGSDLIAAARISSTGAIISGFGIAASVHPETGLYRLTLCDPPKDEDNIILSVTVKQGFPGAMTVADVVMGGFVEVRLADCGCASMDQDFFILAFDGNPKCKPKCDNEDGNGNGDGHGDGDGDGEDDGYGGDADAIAVGLAKAMARRGRGK